MQATAQVEELSRLNEIINQALAQYESLMNNESGAVEPDLSTIEHPPTIATSTPPTALTSTLTNNHLTTTGDAFTSFDAFTSSSPATANNFSAFGSEVKVDPFAVSDPFASHSADFSSGSGFSTESAFKTDPFEKDDPFKSADPFSGVKSDPFSGADPFKETSAGGSDPFGGSDAFKSLPGGSAFDSLGSAFGGAHTDTSLGRPKVSVLCYKWTSALRTMKIIYSEHIDSMVRPVCPVPVTFAVTYRR